MNDLARFTLGVRFSKAQRAGAPFSDTVHPLQHLLRASEDWAGLLDLLDARWTQDEGAVRSDIALEAYLICRDTLADADAAAAWACRAVASGAELPPLAPTIENALGQTIAYADLMNLLGPLDERPDEDAMIRAHWLAIGHVFDDALLCLGTLQTDRLPEEGRRLMAWCLAGTGDWPQLESMLDSEQTAEACARVWLLQGPLNRFDEGLDLRVELCHEVTFNRIICGGETRKTS